MLRKILEYADQQLEQGFKRKVNWPLTLVMLAFYASFFLPALTDNALLKHEGTVKMLIITSTAYILMTLIYGLIMGLLTALLLKASYYIFDTAVGFRDILLLYQTAYKPFIFGFFLYLIRIAVANYSETSMIQNNLDIVGFFWMILSPILIAIALWSAILFYRGLNKLTGFKFYQNFLIHLTTGIVLSPINVYIINN